MALGKNLNRKKDLLFSEDYKEKSAETNLKSSTIKLSGSITISNIKKTINQIKKNISTSDKVMVIVEKIDPFDLTFLQLISALKKEKKVHLTYSEFSSTQMVQLGFSNLEN